MKATLTASQTRSNKYLPVFFVFILIFIASIMAYDNLSNRTPASVSANVTTISQNVLEQKYGLRVNLLAVTAAGGMVDLRLKMLDGEKAKTLLQDKKNFPALLVSDNNITLSASEDTSSQEIKFENNGGLYLLFPNTGNAVKPGSKVTLVFGDLQVEPMAAK